MTDYALVDDQDAILQYRKFDSAPTDPLGKPWRWLPLIVTDPPVGPNQIKEGPVITVNPTDVSKVFTVRDKTQQEIDGEADKIDNDKKFKTLALWLANEHGRTPSQMKSELVAIRKTL